MDDRSNPDTDLQSCVEMLFRLWEDIRFCYRALPKPLQVGTMSRRWVTHPPTRNVIPRLITHAAMQPVSPQERVLIMHGVTAWGNAYTQLVAIAAIPREQRQVEMYLEATRTLFACADDLARAAVSLRRDMRRKRRRHGLRPVD